MITDKELKGKEIQGFKFESHKYNGLHYAAAMNACIGSVGTILYVGPEHVDIAFTHNGGVAWTYPKELVIQRLFPVECERMNEIPADTELSGKMIRGFKFEAYKYNDLYYAAEMDKFIGVMGTILDVNDTNVDIAFLGAGSKGRVTWTYPRELVIHELLTDGLNQLTPGSAETEIFQIL